MDVVLVDASPLVAILDKGDDAHERCAQLVVGLRPLVSVWPVIAEAAHLLRQLWPAPLRLLELVEGGALRMLALTADDVPRMKALVAKYRDLPMDFADAALVRVAEREGIRRVFTLDKDFAIYRPAKIGRFEIVR